MTFSSQLKQTIIEKHTLRQGQLCNAYIHSFITEIYIAPIQGYYSEALPTLARLKRRVLRLE